MDDGYFSYFTMWMYANTIDYDEEDLYNVLAPGECPNIPSTCFSSL